MAVMISLGILVVSLIGIVLALGVCRASAQAEDMLSRLRIEHADELLDGQRS